MKVSEDETWVMARRAAADFGRAGPGLEMNVYCVKAPFAVLVDKDFPRKDRFTVLLHGRPFFISTEDVAADDPAATKEVRIAFGLDFTLGCDYSTANGTKVHSITMFRNGEYLIDLNADGHFDKRQRVPTQISEKPPKPEIWYRNGWRECTNLGKYAAKLGDGTVVKFDIKGGQWRSTMEERKERKGVKERKGDKSNY
jgi:hypothetical protein